MGKQSQLLLQPTEVELGLQVGVEFDIITRGKDNPPHDLEYHRHKSSVLFWKIVIIPSAISTNT